MIFRKYPFIRLSPLILAALITLCGCNAFWHSESTDQTYIKKELPPKANPKSILLTEDDIKRPYDIVADITVRVNKSTPFHSDPTKEQVKSELREDAAELGGDAVIFIRYGETGVSTWSPGALEGKGRVVKYK